MITSKERAKLRSIVSVEQPVYIVGKDSLTEKCVAGIYDALLAREVIKINVLPTCDKSAREISESLVEQLDCEIVGVIGRKIIAYKYNPKNKKHAL